MNLAGAEFEIKAFGAFKEIVVFSIDIKYKIILTLSNTNFVKINKLNIMFMLKSGYETGHIVRTISRECVTL